MKNIDHIYREHAQTVYKFLLSQCSNSHLAEELTQETFYQAVKSIDRYDGSCKISVWLCQIAKHLWYQYLEKNKKVVPVSEFQDVQTTYSAEDEVINKGKHLELLKQIHDLPDPGREVVYLRIFGNLSFREIGDVMGKTGNWARVTFYRSKERIKGGIGYEK